MSKLSPGPWDYGESGIVVGDDRNRICQLLSATLVDAKAICAVPEMLELLRELDVRRHNWAYMSGTDDYSDPTMRKVNDLLKRIDPGHEDSED